MSLKNIKRKGLEALLIAGGLVVLSSDSSKNPVVQKEKQYTNISIKSNVKESYESVLKYIDRKIGKIFGKYIGPFSSEPLF